MTKNKDYPNILLGLGCLVFGWGLIGAIWDQVSRSHNLYPFNFGIILGLGAHMIIGLFAILVAICLKRIEERLDRLEKQSSMV